MLPQNPWVKGKIAFLSSNRAEIFERICYFLLLLLLPTQLGKHFWPTYAFVSGFRVDYLSPTLYVTDLFILLLAGLSFGRMIMTRKRLDFSGLLPFLLIIFFLFLTLLQAPSLPAGLYSLVKVTELLFFGWYTARVMADAVVRRVTPRVFLLSVTGEAGLALVQVATKGSLGGLLYWLGERTISSLTPGAATVVLNGEVLLRPYGTFSHPNVLAGFLLISLTYLLFSRTAFPSPAARFLWGGGLILGSAGLLSTLSRVPILLWLTILLATLIWVLLRHAKRVSWRTGTRGLGAALVLLLLSLPLLPSLLSRFTQSSVGEESFVVRVDLLQLAAELIRGHPLLGVGLGNFLLASAPLRDDRMPLYLAIQPVHNIFLLVTAETGILGFFISLWFLGLSFLKALPPVRVILTLILLIGLVDHYFLTLQQGQLLLAFFLGCSWLRIPAREL